MTAASTGYPTDLPTNAHTSITCQVRFFEMRKLVRRLVSAERAMAQQEVQKLSGGEEEVGRLKARHKRLLADLEVGVCACV